MNTLFKDFGEFYKIQQLILYGREKILFNAPTIDYLALPKKRITYSISNIVAIESAIF